jgi:hypothetical protein
MKHPKTLGLTAVAALGLIALAGACTASATVMCKNEACTETYSAGTATKERSIGTIQFKSEGTVMDECGESVIEGEVENAGSETTTDLWKVQGQTWGICSGTTLTVKKGNLEYHAIPKTFDGTVTGNSAEITFVHAGISCTYSTGNGNGVDIGKYVFGNPPRLIINAKLPKVAGGFLCSPEIEWLGEYEHVAPVPLYFE